MDVLSDVLRVARLKGAVFLHAEFTAPWCISAQVAPEMCHPFMGAASHIICYHYVAQGNIVVQVNSPDATPVMLGAGEVVLFPHNDLHRMGSEISASPTPTHEVIQADGDTGLHRITHGGGGKPTKLVCGFLGCAGLENNPVLSTLPPVLLLNTEQGSGTEWIRSTFQFAADEVANGMPGSSAVLAKLSELLFIEAIRRFLSTLPDGEGGWLAGLRDPYVSKTLTKFHGQLAHPWTMDNIAQEVGLSRSALADRFQQFIGMAPIQYLAHWRMQVAAQELQNSTASLAQIAQIVGYESEAAFSRAFKRAYDTAPAAWRKAHKDKLILEEKNKNQKRPSR